MRQKLKWALEKYPGLKGFYRAKEKARELYRQESKERQLRFWITSLINGQLTALPKAATLRSRC